MVIYHPACLLTWHCALSQHGRGYTAVLPSCGPLLILSSSLKCWGTPKRQVSCRQCSHLWATAKFVLRAKVLGNPHAAAVMQPIRPLAGQC